MVEMIPLKRDLQNTSEASLKPERLYPHHFPYADQWFLWCDETQASLLVSAEQGQAEQAIAGRPEKAAPGSETSAAPFWERLPVFSSYPFSHKSFLCFGKHVKQRVTPPMPRSHPPTQTPTSLKKQN